MFFFFHSSFSFPSRFTKSLQCFEYTTYVLIFRKVGFLILPGTEHHPRAGKASAVLHWYSLDFAFHTSLFQEKYAHFFVFACKLVHQ